MDRLAGLRRGTLVKRSEHWNKNRSGNYRDQIGIVVDLEFYAPDGSECGMEVVTWPVVHWEGEVMESLTHPDNVALFREKK